MLVLHLSICVSFYIRHFYDNKYMCDISEGTEHTDISVCDTHNKTNFSTNIINGYVYIKTDSRGVLSISDRNTLTISEYKGSFNQQFVISMVEFSTYIILYQDKCIEYIPSLLRYEIRSCTINGYQLFTIMNKKHRKKYRIYDNIKGFPLYGDSDMTYHTKCKSNGKCQHNKLVN